MEFAKKVQNLNVRWSYHSDLLYMWPYQSLLAVDSLAGSSLPHLCGHRDSLVEGRGHYRGLVTSGGQDQGHNDYTAK